MQYRHHDSDHSSHGTDFHSYADGGSDDHADFCGDACGNRARSKAGAISMVIYVLLGAMGVPVLAGFSGGFQYLVGPTGGFLISFPIMAYLIGVGTKLRKQKGMFLLFLILGTAANYAIGVAMFCVLMKASVWTGFTACVLPFIPTAIIKAAVASVLGLKLQVRLGAALQWT